MNLGRGSRSAAALLLVVLAGARPSRAQPALTYDLDYVADVGCPERAAFEAWVQAQLREARETTPGAQAHAAVRLQAAASGATASVELTRADGSRYQRELSGESCEAAAQGLAFVLAYALGGGDAEDAPVPEMPQESPATAPARAAAPVSAPVETSSPQVAPIVASAPRPRSSMRWGAALQLGARTGLGPTWTWVEAAALDLRRRDGVLAPVLRVAVLHGEPIQRLDAAGSTELSWLAGRLELCPLQLPLARTLKALPCLATHVGRITAEGKPTSAPELGRRAREPWVDAAAALRLELSLFGVLQLEAQGELLAPLTPYRFAFDHPDTSVYQVPALATAGYLGLGAYLP
ncbi:MAG: hypothetical protein ABUL60_21190 [Myxococcales bacterium]